MSKIPSEADPTVSSLVPPKFTDDASITQHLRRPALLLFLISAAVFVVYWVSLSFGFVWRDNPQIVANPILRSWHNLPQVYLPHWGEWSGYQFSYRPLFTTWSMLNYWLFRLKPWGWHLTNILLHIAVVCTVYVLARKLLLPIWTAFLGCALFALHPIHIEVISWISAASQALATLFCLLALISYIRARESDTLRRVAWRIVSFTTLACALLADGTTISFFLIIGLYVLVLPAPSTRDRIREFVRAALPYAIVTVAYLMLRRYSLHALVLGSAEHHSLSEVVLTLPYVLGFYLRLLVCPFGLSGLYYTPYISPQDLGKSLGSILFLAGIVGLLWYWYKKREDKQIVFLSLWTLLTLAPALYRLRFSSEDLVHDRYAYLPSVGVVLLAAKALSLLPGVEKVSERVVQLAAAALLLVAFAVGAEQQIYWADERSLFQRAHDSYPKNDVARASVSRLLAEEDGDFDEIASLKESIRVNPSNRAYLLLAEAYLDAEDNAAARQIVSHDVILTAEGISMIDAAELSRVYSRLGDHDRALRLCDLLLHGDPYLIISLNNCGAANFRAGNMPEAERLLIRAVESAPDDPVALYWLGRVDLQVGRLQDAQTELRKAVELNSQIADYHYWLGRTMERAGDSKQAEEEYHLASVLKKPDPKTLR